MQLRFFFMPCVPGFSQGSPDNFRNDDCGQNILTCVIRCDRQVRERPMYSFGDISIDFSGLGRIGSFDLWALASAFWLFIHLDNAFPDSIYPLFLLFINLAGLSWVFNNIGCQKNEKVGFISGPGNRFEKPTQGRDTSKAWHLISSSLSTFADNPTDNHGILILHNNRGLCRPLQGSRFILLSPFF